MKEIKKMYLITGKHNLGEFSTGLLFEMEDGSMYKENTTDPIQKYSKLENPIKTLSALNNKTYE